MKKLYLLVIFVVTSHISFAQWNLNGSILENVNSGDVVISGSSNLRVYGRFVTYYPKSNSPLGGEILGTSGYWGFRTDTDNRFHVDIYNANNPRSAFNIDQAGNVGIGTGIPSSQLHLTSNVDHAFRITRANGMYGFRIFRNAGQGHVLFQNTDDSNNPGTRIRFDEGGSGWKNVLINPDEGNVGIGTVSPWAKLHIVGQSADNATGLVRLDAGNATASLRVGISTDYAWIQSHGGRPLYINDIGNNTILNGQAGNVGIGPILPSTKLHIMGQPGDSGTGLVRLDAVNTTASLRLGINADYAWIQSHGGRPLYINDFGNNTILNTQGGNVGIGTMNPDAKLAVKGTVHAQEVKVDLLVPGPDYVFEPTYNLPTLAETEAYIKANKHLPEVPSAKEMEANGINLSEMNMLLLKKVEELTLYQIEATKNIQLLHNQVQELLKNQNRK